MEGSLKSKDVFKTWHFGWQKRKSEDHREIKRMQKLNVWRRGALGIMAPLLARMVALGKILNPLNFVRLCTFWGTQSFCKRLIWNAMLCLTKPIHGERGYDAHDVSDIIT